MEGSTCGSVRGYFGLSNEVVRALDPRRLEAFARLLYDALLTERQVFVFGNGCSALTASHYVCDFIKTAAVEGRPRLRAISLSDSVGLATAIGDDLGYDKAFIYPLETYALPGDLAVAISPSGNSPSILRACEWARANGLTVIALTGFAGGRLRELADVHINAPCDNVGMIEDMHLAIGHVVSQMLRSWVLEQTEVLGGPAARHMASPAGGAL